MKKTNLIYIIFIVALGIIIPSCEREYDNDDDDDDDDKKETKISRNFDDESHNFGESCMNCHISGGEGEGNFSLAGSIYKANLSSKAANGLIKFYSKPNGKGTLITTVEVDDKANFYTTKDINFDQDVYPVAVGKSGNMKFMSAPITNGSCNSCHGNTTEKLWID